MFRNYSDQGYFLEKIFPMHKTRFITVSDPKIDSYLHPEALLGLEIPINGLMNDRFAAKTSFDVRATFATKRRKGEFIGAFAPYGYKKASENKNALVIDEEAAKVVQTIFQWFVYEGMSKNGIARRLNELGIVNPTAYKKSKGLNFSCPHTGKNDGLWSPGSVSSILKNQMYTGTMVQGKPIGLFGDITMFSFHAIKIFNTIEGGMLMYQQDSLQRVFQLYRNFGISYHELGNDTECIGINAKMNEFQAAMGIVNLSGLENEIQKRKELTDIYCQGLKDIPGIQTYDYKDGIRYNYAYFPVKVWKEYGITRDELWRKLKDMGIGTRKLYDKLTCDFQCYKDCGYIRKTDYADQIKQAALDLPIYGTMDKKDAEYICDAIRKLSK